MTDPETASAKGSDVAATKADLESGSTSGSVAGSAVAESAAGTAGTTGAAPKRGFRFWAIITTLCVIGILSALENTVVTTSLPFIVNELELGQNYIWVTNAFFLTR